MGHVDGEIEKYAEREQTDEPVLGASVRKILNKFLSSNSASLT